MTRAVLVCIALLGVLRPAAAQNESQLGSEFRKEREQLRESCGDFNVGAIGGCVYTLATANPLHIGIGSVAPGNGVAFGPALVGHHTPNENLRMTWSVDAGFAPGGAWRTGGYVNFVPTKVKAPVAVFDPSAAGNTGGLESYPVFSIYAQAISLDRLQFFGIGPESTEAGRSNWTMDQRIVGGRALFPVRGGRYGLTLLGELTGRVVKVGAQADGSTPPIDLVHPPGTAPGIGDDRRFLQLAGGVRYSPPLGIHVRPSYEVRFDGFRGESDAQETFSRWTVDLVHEVPFYRTSRPSVRPANTPNDCSTSPDDHACPSPSRNRYGAFSFRVLTIGSRVDEANTIPFYLQPTLGGSDINGTKLLTSFADYRFRAPNLLAVQTSVEHSLPALPVGHGFALPFGAFFMAEWGRVANQWSDVFGSLEPSYAAGLTLRAGGFPEVFLVFAFGGDSHHFMGTINPALLGGSSRPSLF